MHGSPVCMALLEVRSVVRKSGVSGKLVGTLRTRHPFATVILALFYIGQVRAALLAYRTLGLLLPLESGIVIFVLLVLTWFTFMWSLEAIRKWNKLGFFLYVASCAVWLTLQLWELLAGVPIPPAFGYRQSSSL
jgi:hypothetical protein